MFLKCKHIPASSWNVLSSVNMYIWVKLAISRVSARDDRRATPAKLRQARSPAVKLTTGRLTSLNGLAPFLSHSG